MLYPIFSYDDGTEVTASKPDAQGNILIYTERFDTKLDQFIHTTIVLPEITLKENTGYPDDEVKKMLEIYALIKDDITDFVNQQVNTEYSHE